jgi:hypothetical protein
MMNTPHRISFLISQKGKRMLNLDNFIFRCNRTTETKKYYRCFDPQCTVTVHTDLNDIALNTKNDHCHSPSRRSTNSNVQTSCKNTCDINESTPIPQIYDEEAARINLSTLSIASLPSQREMS